MAIGGAVSGGATVGSVLFVGAGALLAQDTGLQWDNTNKQLILAAGTGALPSLALVDVGTGLYRHAANAIGLATAGVGRWQLGAAGDLRPIANNVYDIGATGIAPRSLFVSTDINSPAFRLTSGSSTAVLFTQSAGKGQFTAGSSITFGFNLTCSTPATTGAQGFVTLTPPANTGQTAGSEIRSWQVGSFTRTWATGALAVQREWAFLATTYAFVAATNVTDPCGLYVEAPLAGANATFVGVGAVAARFNAKVRIDAEVALGGGAAPTLGTIGGAGPAGAAQVGWLEVVTQNGIRFTGLWA